MSTKRNELLEEVEILRQFSLDLLSSIQLLRWVGFGLLSLFGLNVIAILIPFRFLDPAWELQAIGQLVERIPLALIGFALVLHGKQYLRTQRSLKLVKLLSWLALLLGLIMLLLIPLTIVDTWRLQSQNERQVQQALAQRLDQVRAVQEKIQATSSNAQLLALIQQFNAQYPNLKIDTNQDINSIQKELGTLAQRASANIKAQSQETLDAQNKVLFQSAFQWGTGALISGIWLVSLWNASDWARKLRNR